MKWDVLVNLERRKYRRQKVKDSAFRGLGALSIVLVLYLGFAESVGKSAFWQQVDKGMHFILFGAFSFMFIQVAQRRLWLRMPVWPRWSLLFCGLSLFCVLTEATHLWMPGRHFEWGDIMANCLGTWIFGTVAAFLFPIKESFRPVSFSPDGHQAKQVSQALRIRNRNRSRRKQGVGG